MSVTRNQLNARALTSLLGGRPPPEQPQPMAVAAVGGSSGEPGGWTFPDGSRLYFLTTPGSDGSIGWVWERIEVTEDGERRLRNWIDPVNGPTQTERIEHPDGSITQVETWTDSTGMHSSWTFTPVEGPQQTSSINISIDPETGLPQLGMVGPDGQSLILNPNGLSINGSPPLAPISIQACVDGETKTLTLLGAVAEP
jgi:hypothetical protein